MLSALVHHNVHNDTPRLWRLWSPHLCMHQTNGICSFKVTSSWAGARTPTFSGARSELSSWASNALCFGDLRVNDQKPERVRLGGPLTTLWQLLPLKVPEYRVNTNTGKRMSKEKEEEGGGVCSPCKPFWRAQQAWNLPEANQNTALSAC